MFGWHGAFLVYDEPVPGGHNENLSFMMMALPVVQ